MKTTYKHPFYVHLLGPGSVCFFAWLAWRMAFAQMVHGDETDRVLFVSGCIVLSLSMLMLYITSALNRYEIRDEGLRVSNFFRNTFHPWSEIVRIDFNRPLHCVFIRGRHGLIAYTSTDCFPNLADLLYAIYERSHCSLPPHLAARLGVYQSNEPG